jgi:hypothetical protein
VRIKKGVDEVTDANAEVLLEEVNFEVLEESLEIFIGDDAFHEY